jgi:hypothetical protein
MPLTKYVKFTEWYSVDLLVLAHNEPDGKRRKVPSSQELLRPKDENYFIVMRCPRCGAYEWFPSRGFPGEDFHPNTYWKAALACPPHTGVCTLADMEKTVVPNYFLIQAGTIGTERVVLPEPTPPTYSKS